MEVSKIWLAIFFCCMWLVRSTSRAQWPDQKHEWLLGAKISTAIIGCEGLAIGKLSWSTIGEKHLIWGNIYLSNPLMWMIGLEKYKSCFGRNPAMLQKKLCYGHMSRQACSSRNGEGYRFTKMTFLQAFPQMPLFNNMVNYKTFHLTYYIVFVKIGPPTRQITF